MAVALFLHSTYTLALDGLHEWIRSDRNAEEAMLLQLLDSIIRRREQEKIEDGNGGDGDGDGPPPMPSADALREAVDGEKARPVRDALDANRATVHTTAKALIAVLESDRFLDTLDGLDPREQIGWLAVLSERLAASAAGLSYLTDAVAVPGPPRHFPALHPSRLELAVDFTGKLDAGQKVLAALYIGLAQNILPGLIARSLREGTPARALAVLPITEKFYEFTKLHADGHITKTIGEVRTTDDLLQLTDELQRYNRKEVRGLVARMGAVAPDVAAFSTGFGLGTSVLKVLEDPSARNTAGLASSVASTALQLAEFDPRLQRRLERELVKRVTNEAIGEVSEVTQKLLVRKLSTKLFAKLNFVTAIIDAGLSFWDAGEAFVKGDTLEGVGHTTGGVGTLATAAGGVVLAKGAATGALSAVALTGGLLVGGGLLLVGAGLVIVLFASDDEEDPRHPLEYFFARSYFGVEWEDVPTNTSPGALDYKWKRWTDPPDFRDRVKEPDLARQVSTFLSWQYPVNIQRAGSDGIGFVVETAPALASPYSFTTLRLIEPQAGEEDENLFVRVPTLPPHDWNRPEEILEGPIGLQPLEEMEGDDRVRFWSCTTKAPMPFEDNEWVEVRVSLPTQVQQMLTGSFGGSLPGVEDQLELALFETRRMPVERS